MASRQKLCYVQSASTKQETKREREKKTITNQQTILYQVAAAHTYTQTILKLSFAFARIS